MSDVRFSTGSDKSSLCEHKQIVQVVGLLLEKKKKIKYANLGTEMKSLRFKGWV